MAKSRVLVVGSGGVGTMAAYALEIGRQAEVTAVCRSNFEAVMKNGFTIDSIEHGHDIEGFRPSVVRNTIPNVRAEGIPPFDYVVVTTKNIPDVKPTVVDIITPAVTAGTTGIVLLQNGLNIEKPVVERFPDNVVLSGVSLIGATETQHGFVRHDDKDSVKLGPFPGQRVASTAAEASARHFIEIYSACGKVDWQYDDNVPFTRWRKLVYNSSFNSIAAILGLDTARMRMSEHIIDDLIRPAMLEIKSVAKAAGYELPGGLEETVIRVDPTDTAFIPSMGQDALKGNYIEMENIVGEPVREAKRLNVAVPTLSVIYGLLRGIQLKAKEQRGLWEPVFPESAKYT